MGDTFRDKMAKLPFEEKIKILEKLRDRDRAIAPVREMLKAEREKKEKERQSNPTSGQ